MSYGLERQRAMHGHPHREEEAGRAIASCVREIDELRAERDALLAAALPEVIRSLTWRQRVDLLDVVAVSVQWTLVTLGIQCDGGEDALAPVVDSVVATMAEWLDEREAS